MPLAKRREQKHPRLHALLISSAIAIILIVLCYTLLNSVMPIEGENSTVRNFEIICNWLQHNNKNIGNNYLLVNTSYDKKLIPKYDDDGFPVGNEPVTDRSKLAAFLTEAAKADNYQMIVLDIDFSFQTLADDDEKLIQALTKAKRVFVSQPLDENGNTKTLINSQLDSISGVVAYAKTKKETNLTRLPLTIGERKSLPLVMAEEETVSELTRHGFFYTYGGHLCTKTIFVYQFVQPVKNNVSENNIIKIHPYENLGSDVLEGDIPLMIKDKIVMIGDLESDIHETYQGENAGPIILLNAYYSILQGRHIFRWWVVLIQFVLYTICGYFIVLDISVYNKIKILKKAPRWLNFLLSFISYSFVFTLVKIALYLINIDFFIIVPTAFFTLWASAHKHLKKSNTNN